MGSDRERKLAAQWMCLIVAGVAMLGWRGTALGQAAAVAAPSAVLSMEVSEPLGMDRGRWPIVVTMPWTLDEAPGDLTLFQVEADGRRAPIAHQWLTHAELPTHGDENAAEAPGVELCFFTELSAGDRQRFVLVASAATPTVSHAPVLAYEGEGFGTVVDTGPVRFALDPLSGQLLNYTPQFAGLTEPLVFRQSRDHPIHWNPDVWAPPLPWGHTSDWDARRDDRRPDIRMNRGPLAYRVVREGEMPTSNGVHTIVSYTFFAGMPFLLEASQMTFTRDTVVNAVRQNELVFSRGLHTHGVYPDPEADGEPALVLLYDEDEPRRFRGRVGRYAPDLPWIGLLHHDGGYGVGIVSLAYENAAPADSVGPQDDQAFYYFQDYGEHGTGARYHYNFAYVCRAVIFHRTVVPTGAVYRERSAFFAFGHNAGGEAPFDELTRWARLIRNPPVVTATMPRQQD